MLVGRSADPRRGLWMCPLCERAGSSRVCPEDGAACLLLDAPRSDASLIRAGTVIADRYRIERMLGRGGFSVVFAAQHVGTGQGVAVKVLSGSIEDDLTALRRFFREARVTAGLRHPSTVRVFDFGQEENGCVYLAMELLTGNTIKKEQEQRAREGSTFSEEEAIEVALAVTQSLAEAHASGLVHRDLKPSNLFLHQVPGNEPVIKVLDFGIAKVMGPALTRADRAIGTAAYMSPEQAKDEPLDGRSDLYGLGLILYSLLAGDVPFRRATALETMLAHLHDPLPDLRVEAQAPVSAGLVAIVERALAKSRADRFQDAQAMRRALLELRAERLRASVTAVVRPAETPRPRRSRLMQLFALSFAAGLLAMGVRLARPETCPPPVIAHEPALEPEPEQAAIELPQMDVLEQSAPAEITPAELAPAKSPPRRVVRRAKAKHTVEEKPSILKRKI